MRESLNVRFSVFVLPNGSESSPSSPRGRKSPCLSPNAPSKLPSTSAVMTTNPDPPYWSGGMVPPYYPPYFPMPPPYSQPTEPSMPYMYPMQPNVLPMMPWQPENLSHDIDFTMAMIAEELQIADDGSEVSDPLSSASIDPFQSSYGEGEDLENLRPYPLFENPPSLSPDASPLWNIASDGVLN